MIKKIGLMSWMVCLICFAGVSFISLSADAAETFYQHLEKNWALTTPLENDKAEIALYRGREIVGRKLRNVEIVAILEKIAGGAGFVRSQWNRSWNVGVTPVQQEMVVVFNAANKTPARLDFSALQWGGTISKWIDFGKLPGAKREGLFLTSHREIQKNSSFNIAVDTLESAVPYEALPVLLRGVDSKLGNFNFNMMEPLASDSMQLPRTGEARVVFTAPSQIPFNGKSYNAQTMTVTHFLGEDVFVYEVGESRTLLKWDRYNGAEYIFRNRQLLDYWNRNAEQDAGLIF